MSNALPDDGVTTLKHVGAVLMSILTFLKDNSLVHQLVNKKFHGTWSVIQRPNQRETVLCICFVLQVLAV